MTLLTLCEKPIGIFDSGLGGLTVVKAVLENMPNENIIYLGDSLNVPYGDKSEKQITEFAVSNARFLLSKGVKAIAVACNTADSVALSILKEKFDIPIVGVVAPASEKAVCVTRNKKIGVIATATAVKSGAYKKAITSLCPDAQVFCQAAPLLVPLVEAGKINKGDTQTQEALLSYITPLKEEGIDTLILGCTHYPLLLHLVKCIAPDINIVCSGESSLDSLFGMLREKGLLNSSEKTGTAEYYVTGESSYFEKHGGIFLGRSLEGYVKKTVM